VGGELAAKRVKLPDGRAASAPTLPDLPGGKHLLTVVVRDPVKPKGERFPWVLKDDRGLLEDRRTWILIVPD